MQNEGEPNQRIVRTEDRYTEKWGWYAILYDLANGDILKMDDVTNLKIYQSLTFLSYKQDRFILEKENGR